MVYDREKRKAGREEKTIELELTNAQLDMIEIALSQGIRRILEARLKELGYEMTTEDIDELWNNVIEKVQEKLF